MKTLSLVLFAFCIASCVSMAAISGRVTDASGKGIPSASIRLENDLQRGVSDARGYFSLTGGNRVGSVSGDQPGATSAVVIVTRKGYLDHLEMVSDPKARLSIGMIVCAGSVKDVEGNAYQAVKLGNQIWTVENLRTRKFTDGTPIPFDPVGATWKDSTAPKYCYPGNTTNSAIIRRFGALYNFYAVATGKLAPPGWHVPSGDEWRTFESWMIANGFNDDISTAGDRIAKSIAAKIGWSPSGVEGAIGNDPAKNNRSGFAAMGTGFIHENGIFEPFGRYTGWWTPTPASSDHAGMIDLHFDEPRWSNAHHYRSACGYGVRLVKDAR